MRLKIGISAQLQREGMVGISASGKSATLREKEGDTQMSRRLGGLMEKRSKSRFERIHGIARIPRDSFQHYRSKEKKMTRRKKKKEETQSASI